MWISEWSKVKSPRCWSVTSITCIILGIILVSSPHLEKISLIRNSQVISPAWLEDESRASPWGVWCRTWGGRLWRWRGGLHCCTLAPRGCSERRLRFLQPEIAQSWFALRFIEIAEKLFTDLSWNNNFLPILDWLYWCSLSSSRVLNLCMRKAW